MAPLPTMLESVQNTRHRVGWRVVRYEDCGWLYQGEHETESTRLASHAFAFTSEVQDVVHCSCCIPPSL